MMGATNSAVLPARGSSSSSGGRSARACSRQNRRMQQEPGWIGTARATQPLAYKISQKTKPPRQTTWEVRVASRAHAAPPRECSPPPRRQLCRRRRRG
eukprot:4665051-Prymnesium_polylepis.1